MIKESATGATRILHFRDIRPPHDVKFALEREIRSLFLATMEAGKLCFRSKANIVGAEYDFLLRFEAVLPGCNCYSLLTDVSWAKQDPNSASYYRKTSGSWFELWTDKLKAATPPLASEGSLQHYHVLCEEALKSEKQLDSTAAIQQAIIAAVKEGARFSTSHKEGGTNIYWKEKGFVRSDYGDYPNEQHFTDETEFLKMLRAFCQEGATLSEFDTWRLILRRMDRQ